MPNEVLSQDYVNQLLGAVDGGEAQLKKAIEQNGGNGVSKDDLNLLLNAVNAGKTKAEAEEANSVCADNNKFYDADYPHKCTKEQIKSLYKIHEKFVPQAVKTISVKLGKPVNISVAAIDQLTMNDLLRSIPNPTTLYIFNMKPLNGSAVMEIYFPVSSDVLPGLMSNLRTAWSEIIDIQPSLEKTETNPDYINIVPRSEGIILVTLEAKNDSAQGMINIVYPYSVIKQIHEKL